MQLFRQYNAGQNLGIKRANRSSENVSQFRDFGKDRINQNLIQEEIKRRLNSSSIAYYHSIQKLTFGSVWVRNIISTVK
jgi:hypothetical protein